MTSFAPQRVVVVGVGLIGGSIGLALKARCPGVHVAGVGRRQGSLDEARAAGAIDSAHLDAAEGAAGADLAVLCTPVCAYRTHLEAIKDVLADGGLITDAGSTKAAVVAEAEDILGRAGRFVGAHPMAGSERKGVAYASADLFEGAMCILTPGQHVPADAIEACRAFWEAIGMATRIRGPVEHDQALARVSHLPHVVSALLMLVPDPADLPLAASGLRDTTRLASGDPEMWRDILLTNREAMLAATEAFGEQLSSFKRLLTTARPEELEAFLAAAKHRRDSTIGG